MIAIAFVVSFLVCFALTKYSHLHQHFSTDLVNSGPQKMHYAPTPRIGGVPVLLGAIAAILALYGANFNHTAVLFLVACMPVWFAGFVEDITKKVSALNRLIAAFISASVGIWLLDAKLTRYGFEMIDHAFAYFPIVNMLFTVFMVGGTTHSLNIIDGFNGLASGITIIILAALSIVSYQVGDQVLTVICLSFLAATVGFFFWNFPRGTIFAGDAGAYLWGFVIAEISVLLVARNPQVSPIFPLLLVIYPVWETLFTIYRRKIVRGRPAGLPDGIHLHTLVYKRLLRNKSEAQCKLSKSKCNAMTSPYLWSMCLFSVIPAVFTWNSVKLNLFFIAIFAMIYCVVYRNIVRFKSMPWLVRYLNFK